MSPVLHPNYIFPPAAKNWEFYLILLLIILGTTFKNQNLIQEEIKSRLKSGNACYHSVQDLLSFSLLFKNLKIKIYRNIILPFVLCGCETWSLTLREEHRLSVFENRVLRRILPVVLYGCKTCSLT